MNNCEICGNPSGKHLKCKECFYKSKLSLQDKYIDIYKRMLSKGWEDGNLTKDENELILTLRNFFGISDELHKKIEEEVKFLNKDIIDSFIITEKINNDLESDFRKKFPIELRTEDGHFVRSKAERDIDNWFHSKEIAHIYEKHEIDIDGDRKNEIFCDFYLPYDEKGNFLGNNRGGIYIEFWGLVEKKDYAKRMAQKKDFYKKKGLKLIDIYEEELHDPERTLTKKFIDIFGKKLT